MPAAAPRRSKQTNLDTTFEVRISQGLLDELRRAAATVGEPVSGLIRSGARRELDAIAAREAARAERRQELRP